MHAINDQIYSDVGLTPAATLLALGAALDLHDEGTHAHSRRVVCYALRLGRVLGLSHDELLTLERGVFLHDIGKIYVPDSILKKPGPLTADEWKVMKRHPAVGYAMICSIPFLRDAAQIVLAHHERYDGTGYPRGLRGQEIPFGARIFAVMDCFDALTSSDRPYRRPITIAEACELIRAKSGSHFDPVVVDAFQAVPVSEWAELQASVNATVDLPH